MTRPLDSLDLRSLTAGNIALFFDFDGTLVEIVQHPELAQLAPATRETLKRIHNLPSSALAIVTGRDIDDVDRFLGPLRLPVAGAHGMKRRASDGSLRSRPVDDAAISQLHDALGPFVASNEGLHLERKFGSVALHYRARPELEQQAVEAMIGAMRELEEFQVQRGKMVIEARTNGAGKGEAIADFLAEAPFAGRLPLFAGDDVTDEDAFEIVNARGGITVKVGSGATQAMYRASDTPEFLDWLRDLADHLVQAESLEQS